MIEKIKEKVENLPYELKDLRTLDAMGTLIDNLKYIPIKELEDFVDKFKKV